MRKACTRCVCLLVILGATNQPVHAGKKREKDSPVQVDTLQKGTSSRKESRAARALIPVQKLNPTQRAQIDEVLKNISHYRKLPELRFEVDPRVYRFFGANPDVAVAIWRVMEISKFKMTRTGDGEFSADAGDGSSGTASVLYQTPTECVAVCDGVYKNPLLLKPIRAKGLMHLRTRYQMDKQQRTFVTHNLNVFVSFPSTTLRTAARVLSPLTNLIMDRNFEEVSVFLQMMTLAMERQPGWVESVARRMNGVQRKQQIDLVDLTYDVNERSLRKLGLGQHVPVMSIEDLLAPLKQTTPGQLHHPALNPNVKNVSTQSRVPIRTAVQTDKQPKPSQKPAEKKAPAKTGKARVKDA